MDGNEALRDLFEKHGRRIPVAGNRPLLLSDPHLLYLLEGGSVSLSAVPLQEGQIAGTRSHLFSLRGEVCLFGMDVTGSSVGLMATGVPGTELLVLDGPTLEKQLGSDKEYLEAFASILDEWVANLSSAVAHTHPPKVDLTLEQRDGLGSTDGLEIPAGTMAKPRSGVLWVQLLEGAADVMGRQPLAAGPEKPFTPLGTWTWLQVNQESRLRVYGSRHLLLQGPIWPHLASFHRLALSTLHQNEKRREDQERRRLQSRSESDQKMVEETLSRLALTIDGRPDLGQQIGRPAARPEDQLLTACQLVSQALGLEAIAPPGPQPENNARALEQIAEASQFRIRPVILRGRWWREDNGPLLAFLSGGGQPIALLPSSTSQYEVVDPAGQLSGRVTAKAAELLQPVAYTFYQRLPLRPISARDLLRLGFFGQRRDLLSIVLASLVVGVMSTVLPVTIGVIFDRVIPGHDRGLLFTLASVLIILMLANVAFDVAQRFAILRIQGRLGLSLQAAVWDRLLRLPTPFFNQYNAGDLTVRALGIDTIRSQATQIVISTILSGVFSLFYFAVLFLYDPGLALVASFLVVLPLLPTALIARPLLRYQREVSAVSGQLSGLVLQLIGGIAKLRVAGAEGRAFSAWGRSFSDLKKATFDARNMLNNVQILNSTYPLLATMVIFAVAIGGGQGSLSTGSFLALFSAFGLLLNSMLGLNSSIMSLLSIVPAYERMRPILQSTPEVDESKVDPGELTGEIEVNNVSFRYHADGPLVLKNISIKVRPGEFIALVGPSGSGKSTLFRLLMGFERPELGSIYYNGYDIDGLDIRRIRRQIGIVLQISQVAPASIYENIIGTSSVDLNLDDAWEAARLAGLEEDIRQMPMGMHTVIGEGGSTFSGGQRQRLLIARAIVSKPRVLFFDEATSALDNQTQAVVSKSLEELEATRLVIAHRLSTIRNADRIYVLNRGELRQQGTYDELIGQDGLFADLVRRQLVD